ncbi:MAG: glycosyltransferase [Bacteroidota bacterium]|nr:glycosyltransferase [Bacteroidota bacterium]
MLLYAAITALLFLPYAIIILIYRKWFLRLKPFNIPDQFIPQTHFTIIIPARNEEMNIGNCLEGIFQQYYPSQLFEIIVIDDHSTDTTAEIVLQLQNKFSNLKLIKLSDELDGKALNSYKKKAIEKAIGYANGDWIITTDADCMVSNKWLLSYAAIIQKEDPVFVAAPVAFTTKKNILSVFQYLDFMCLQGITAASVSAGFHTMCNGANLAYRKDAFYSVNGFKGIDTIASGDDMLLMNKIKKRFPSSISFLFSKEAIVFTHPMKTWKDFFNQRIRWASKADKYKDKSILSVLILVYFYNLLLFVMPFLALIQLHFLWAWLILIVLKTLVEITFVLPVGKFFGKTYITWFPFMEPLHISYTVIAGWLGKFGSYQWKGRNVK